LIVYGKIYTEINWDLQLLPAYGGPVWTVPELVFEKKQLIPALQQLIIDHLFLSLCNKLK